MRSTVRVKVENCPAFSIRVVEGDAIAEFGHEKRAVAFRLRIVEAEIHAAVIEYTDAASLIARSVVKDNAGGGYASFLGFSLNNWIWHWRPQREPHYTARVHNGDCTHLEIFLGSLDTLPSGKQENTEQHDYAKEKEALSSF